MGFSQRGHIQCGLGAVRIHACIHINIMRAGQLAVHRHAVVAGYRSIHQGSYSSFHPAGIGFRRHIHLDLVAAAEGDVVTGFIFTLLFQLHFFIDRNLIGGRDKRIAVRIDIFRYAAAFAFHLVIDIQIGIGIVNLPLACRNFGGRTCGTGILIGLSNVYVGSGFNYLFGFDVRRYLDHAAHVHMVVPGFPVIGPGHNLVSCCYIALARSQPGSFFQFGPGIHLHIIIGVGPGHT